MNALSIACFLINMVAFGLNLHLRNYFFAGLSAFFVVFSLLTLTTGCTTAVQSNSSNVNRTPQMRAK